MEPQPLLFLWELMWQEMSSLQILRQEQPLLFTIPRPRTKTRFLQLLPLQEEELQSRLSLQATQPTPYGLRLPALRHSRQERPRPQPEEQQPPYLLPQLQAPTRCSCLTPQAMLHLNPLPPLPWTTPLRLQP